MKIGLICTMAGKSTRMGQPKQHVLIGGRTFLDHILAASKAASLEPRVFVGQPGDGQSRTAVAAAGGLYVENHDLDLGPLHSIRLGLERLPLSCGFLLWPIDHPLVAAPTLATILAAAEREPERVIVPSDGERRGHPVFFPAWTRDDLLTGPLEEGARWVLRRHSERISYVTTDDIWILRNLNTPERLAEAQARLAEKFSSPG